MGEGGYVMGWEMREVSLGKRYSREEEGGEGVRKMCVHSLLVREGRNRCHIQYCLFWLSILPMTRSGDGGYKFDLAFLSSISDDRCLVSVCAMPKGCE